VEILKLLTLHERLTIAEIVKLTNANQNTLKVRLRELVELRRIQRFGKARATWYRLAQLPFQGF
jgi:DNA-binding IclR family transcriptional regulator